MRRAAVDSVPNLQPLNEERSVSAMARPRKKPVFQNPQWKVTRYGMEAQRPESYSIEANRLPQTRNVSGRECYDWPLHMAEKREWVCRPWFNEVFVEAMKFHHGGYDRAMYERTLAAIREQLTS